MRRHTTLLGTVLLAFASVLSYAQSPVPFINLPLIPDATAPGGGDFTLTVYGTGFVSTSVVNWNGSALATQLVNGSQLMATVPAADIAFAGTVWVTVVNPAPGGGMSNLAFLTIAANAGNSIRFGLASTAPVGTNPDSVAVGDFNGDGKLDLAVANSLSNTVSVLLGDGAGNFNLASSPATGANPFSVAAGDFNGDGKLDLVIANYNDNTLSVLMGDGTGNFTLASSQATGTGPSSVAVGDFNGDGKLDLAVANVGSNTVSVLLGDGTGHFALVSSPVTGTGPRSVAVGDFNGDGKLDLAVANVSSNSVSVLLGDGTGNFTLASSPATGISPFSVTAGDFNGDGKLDLAVANYSNNTLSILLGDGTGNFTLTSSPATGNGPLSVAAGDFNADGNLDLAVPSSSGVSLLLGDGIGNFTLAASPAAGSNSNPQAVAVGDFNGDGKLDLAVPNQITASGSYGVSVFVQRLPGTAVAIFPTNLNFGTQASGTHGDSLNLTMSNIGSMTLDITSIASSAGFSEMNGCGSSLAPGARCLINVLFAPQHRRGTITGTVTITDNAPNSPQTVALTGIGTVVSLSTASLTFGTQTVGTTSLAQKVTLTNRGQAALNIFSFRFSGSNGAAFAQTNTCGTSVPEGGSCTISVSFAPRGAGKATATLGMFDDGGGSPQTVALTGVGTSVGLSPPNLNFGNQKVGTTSQPLTITLTNDGKVAVNVFPFRITGRTPTAFAQTNTCGTSVPAGGSCTISVTFTPHGNGIKTATLDVFDNGGGSPQTATLYGQGTM